MASVARMKKYMPRLIKFAPLAFGDTQMLCDACGISTYTYRRWENESRELIVKIEAYMDARPNGEYILSEEDELLCTFNEEVVMEMAQSDIRQMAKIVLDDDWRSAAWLFERTQPAKFARRKDIANVEELIKFVMKYYGKDARDALEYVMNAIEVGREERMKYDEEEAEYVNTRTEAISGRVDEPSPN